MGAVSEKNEKKKENFVSSAVRDIDFARNFSTSSRVRAASWDYQFFKCTRVTEKRVNTREKRRSRPASRRSRNDGTCELNRQESCDRATYVNFNPTDETKILLPEIYPFSFSRAIRYFLSFFLKLYVPPEIVESRRNVNKTFNDDTLFLFPSFFCFLITEKNINFLCFEMNTVFSTS